MFSLYTISTWIHRISFIFIQFCIKKYDLPSVQSIHDPFSKKNTCLLPVRCAIVWLPWLNCSSNGLHKRREKNWSHFIIIVFKCCRHCCALGTPLIYASERKRLHRVLRERLLIYSQPSRLSTPHPHCG